MPTAFTPRSARPPVRPFAAAIECPQNFHKSDIFHQVSSSNGGRNFVFSPFSLHLAMAMLISGADDGSETQDQMFKLMGRMRDIKKFQRNYKQLLREYRVSEK